GASPERGPVQRLRRRPAPDAGPPALRAQGPSPVPVRRVRGSKPTILAFPATDAQRSPRVPGSARVAMPPPRCVFAALLSGPDPRRDAVADMLVEELDRAFQRILALLAKDQLVAAVVGVV